MYKTDISGLQLGSVEAAKLRANAASSPVSTPKAADCKSDVHMKKLFAKQGELIKHFFDHVDIKAIDELANHILQSDSNVILSGVGKSAIVAQKICQSMISTGTPAAFLNPVEALHGDIGIVRDNDVLLLFSKSGETAELLSLLPFVKARCYCVAITCNPDSRLNQVCNHSIYLPLERELCPFNMSPSTSAILQLIFGDTLSVALMERRGFTRTQYAANHPSGRIGRRLTFKVEDLMLTGKEVPTCKMDATMMEYLTEMSKGCGGVMVVDDKERLIGLFSDGDLRRALVEVNGDATKLSVKKIMVDVGRVRTTSAGTLAYDAMQSMEKGRPINFLPVLGDEGVLVGILRLHDCVKAGL